MEENQSCFYVPIWIIGIGMIILSLIGCKKLNNYSDLEPFSHTCPEYGHGDCPICCDPYRNENEETIVFDR